MYMQVDKMNKWKVLDIRIFFMYFVFIMQQSKNVSCRNAERIMKYKNVDLNLQNVELNEFLQKEMKLGHVGHRKILIFYVRN